MLVSTNNTFLSTNMASIKFISYCALLCYLWTGALTHCNLITNHLSICETQHECFVNVPRRNSFLNVYIFYFSVYLNTIEILIPGRDSQVRLMSLFVNGTTYGGTIFQSFTSVLLYILLRHPVQLFWLIF